MTNQNKPTTNGASVVRVSGTAILIAIVAIVLFCVGAVVYLVVVRRELDQVIAIVSLLAAPTVISMFNLLRVDAIKQQTNGALSRMDDRLTAMEDSGSTPVASSNEFFEGGNSNGK